MQKMQDIMLVPVQGRCRCVGGKVVQERCRLPCTGTSIMHDAGGAGTPQSGIFKACVFGEMRTLKTSERVEGRARVLGVSLGHACARTRVLCVS